ncbi:hypothetical protein JCM11491_006102 [Sporobolomyces phaffii]
MVDVFHEFFVEIANIAILRTVRDRDFRHYETIRSNQSLNRHLPVLDLETLDPRNLQLVRLDDLEDGRYRLPGCHRLTVEQRVKGEMQDDRERLKKPGQVIRVDFKDSLVLQPTMAFERQLFEGEGRRDFLYWLALPWLALSWSGIIATWAILSSHVAQLQARGKCTSSRCVRVVNSSGIVFLALYTLILVPPAVVVGHLYDKLIRDLDRVSDILTTLSQSWTGGLPDLVPATPVLEALGQAAIDYFRNLQILFTIFAAVSVVLALVMTIAGYFYLSLLRQEIESIGEPFSSHHGLVLRPTSSHIKLRRVWKTILFTVSVNVVIAVLLAVNSLMIAVAPEHLADRNHLRIALLMPLFSVGAFGLLSAVLLFVRALEAAPSDDKLTTAAREVVVEPRGGRKVAQESEEATMVGSASSLKGVVFKESGSRRSSWFGGGGTRTSGIPLQSKIMVDVEIQIDEERTTTCRSLEV